jgi:hypothetical protein
MLMRSSVNACIAAIFFVGCGAVQEESGLYELGSQEQAYLLNCTSDSVWVRHWYTDFSRRVLTGRDYCCRGEYRSEGTWGNSYVHEQGPGCGSYEVDLRGEPLKPELP